MKLVIIFAVLILFFGALEVRNYIVELEKENEFLKERWKRDIERDIQRTEREIKRTERKIARLERL